MKITIIIPVYNGAKFIEKCLDSVYKQGLNRDSFEVLAINDGSTDESESIINEYAKKVDNVKLVNKENGGVSTARNMGIEAAKGDFVLFLDADDELVEGSLQLVYDYLCENSGVDMVVTKQSRHNGLTERIINNAQNLQEKVVYTGVETYKKGYVRSNAGGAICSTEFLHKTGLRFPTGIKNGEDTIFFGLIHVYAKEIVLLNVLLYRINEVPGSASRSDYDKLGLNFSKTLNKAIEIRNNLNCNPEQKGVMEYVVYRILSMLTYCSIKSKGLTCNKIKKIVDFKGLLPFDTRYMYRMRRKAQLINISYCLFYFLSYLDNKRL